MELEPAPRPTPRHRCELPRRRNFGGRRWQCDDCGIIWRYSDAMRINSGPVVETAPGMRLGWLIESLYDWDTEYGGSLTLPKWMRRIAAAL